MKRFLAGFVCGSVVTVAAVVVWMVWSVHHGRAW